MTRIEKRETKKKQFQAKLIILLVVFLFSFVLGAFSHKLICLLSHEEVHKIELSGSSTIYLVNEQTGDIEEIEIDTEEEFISYYTYTEDELDLLSRLIYSEGGTESYETKLKIGSVVMNRVSDPDFPDTIQEVIYQKNQFAVTTTKVNGVTMIDRPADEDSKKAAREVLDYGSVLPPDVQVFYSKSVASGNWVTTRKKFGTFDNTVFAYIYS